MISNKTTTHIAYRCPNCGTVIYGIAGRFALNADMLRLKCSCNESSLDIKMTNDGKVRLSVPCIFCKQNHNYVVSQNIFFSRELFLLNCPYSNMDICFIGEKDKTDKEIERTGKELEHLLSDLEAESIKDMQPIDINEEDVLPDPTIYDSFRFLVKSLEDEGKIDCPCHSGSYDIRFIQGGIQVYCPTCGSTYDFNTEAASASEEYLYIDELKLH